METMMIGMFAVSGAILSATKCLKAIATRHHYIQGDCIRAKATSLLHCCFSRLCHGNAIIGRQVTGDQLTSGEIVVDNEDKRLLVTFPGHDQWAGRFVRQARTWDRPEPAGRVKVNRLPFPNSLSTEIWPPSCSTSRFVIASPKPVPS